MDFPLWIYLWVIIFDNNFVSWYLKKKWGSIVRKRHIFILLLMCFLYISTSSFEWGDIYVCRRYFVFLNITCFQLCMIYTFLFDYSNSWKFVFEFLLTNGFYSGHKSISNTFGVDIYCLLTKEKELRDSESCNLWDRNHLCHYNSEKNNSHIV